MTAHASGGSAVRRSAWAPHRQDVVRQTGHATRETVEQRENARGARWGHPPEHAPPAGKGPADRHAEGVVELEVRTAEAHQHRVGTLEGVLDRDRRVPEEVLLAWQPAETTADPVHDTAQAHVQAAVVD